MTKRTLLRQATDAGRLCVVAESGEPFEELFFATKGLFDLSDLLRHVLSLLVRQHEYILKTGAWSLRLLVLSHGALSIAEVIIVGELGKVVVPMRDKLCHSHVLVVIEAPIRLIVGITVLWVTLGCRVLDLRLRFCFFEVVIFKVIEIFIVSLV